MKTLILNTCPFKMFKLFKEWKKCSKYFVKPKLKFYFGKWKNDPCLPVWRTPKTIYFTRNSKYVKQVYSSHCVKIDGKYNLIIHKLPGNLKNYDYVWNSNIRRFLKKYHLSWIKPFINLPMWLSFYIFNHDIMWKTKYDDIRYEFPPQFTIVLFGYSLSIWACNPTKDTCNDSFYYEAMLNHNYRDYKSLYDLVEQQGFWTSRGEGRPKAFLSVKKEFIQPRYRVVCQFIAEKLSKEYPQYDWEL